MKCEQAELLMAELLAGEIRPEGRGPLEGHLVECATCRADFGRAREGFRVEWPGSTPPRAVERSTRAQFGEPPSILRFLRFGTAAAAAIVAALLILVSDGEPPRPGAAAVPAARPPYLASVQPAVVGTLEARDEDGRPAGELGLQSHVVSVEIMDGIAKTTVEENFRNHTDRRLEGTFLFPLPPDASISRLALEVNGKIEEGTCLERERAREVFEGIVRRMKDPALLEWMPGGIFQCRIFPIEPRATKRVIVAYTQALAYFRGTMTYVYPLASEKTKAHPPEELRIDVAARFSGELLKMESPSHRLDVQRARPNEARASFAARNLRPENDFVLTMETSDDELRVVPHKVDGDDGYFALFLTPRGAPARAPGRYAFVLDVSASVTGPELEVARRLVRAMMERRVEGDRFEILAHHIDVQRSGEVDLRAANDFMDRLTPVGGRDLLGALRAAPEESEIIYIGGGTPTFGEAEPAKILDAMRGRRVRTIGVGNRVNVQLLERLGGFFRISPNDDVNRRCSEIAATLGSPALSEIRVDGGQAVYDVVGARDVFYGERLVLTGRYRGPAAKLVVTARGYRRELEVAFPGREDRNNYVRRLWAQRKIADLLALPDKKAEVTELGVKHQIMTPYTSFLVLESEQMWKDHQLKREVQKEDEVLGRKGRSTEVPEAPKVEPKPAPPPTVKPPDPGSTQNTRSPELREGFEGLIERERRQVTIKKLPGLVRNWRTSPGADRSPREVDELDVTLMRGNSELRSGAPVYDSPARNLPHWSTYAQTFARSNQFGGLEFTPDVLSVDGIYQGIEGTRWREVTAAEDGGLTFGTLGRMAGDRDVNEWDGFLALPAFGGEGQVGRLYDPKPEADMQVFVRQLEVRLAERQELSARIGEYRTRLSRALGEKATSASELEFARRQVEKLSQDLAELEGKHIEMARDKKNLEEKLNHLNQTGVNADIAPRKPLEGKVTAVAGDIGMVVISIGKDDGVLEGDDFTVYRGGDFVARIRIDRADRHWSAGRIVVKNSDPRAGDDASNHIYVGAPRGGPVTTSGKVTAASSGWVALDAALPTDKAVAITRDQNFVAVVLLTGIVEGRSQGRVWRGVAADSVRAGDQAEVIGDLAGFLAGLPAEAKADLASQKNLDSIRRKMGY